MKKLICFYSPNFSLISSIFVAMHIPDFKISLFLLLFSFSNLFANPQTLFEAANKAFQEGNYGQAIEHYEAILQSGNYSDELYYNLGNAYFKNANLGKSILNYERALLLSPRDEDVQFNLEIAQAKTQDDLEQIRPFFLTEWWRNVHQLFSSGLWGALTLLSLWAAIGGFILWLLGSTRERKKQGFIGGILLLLLSVLLFFVSNSQAKFEKNSQFAIVLAPSIELKNGPDKESTAVLEIHEGLKIQLLDQIGDWQKVKLSNGDQGWLPEGSFEEI
jgi:tetratricopeptide (TPR) repeat protein